MSTYKFFDLHCDTISECLDQGVGLRENTLDVALSRADFSHWVQAFALFIHDEYRGAAAWDRFLAEYAVLESQIKQNNLFTFNGDCIEGVCNVLVSVEGGHVLGGDLSKIKTLHDMGVKMLTLVWNGDNELGCGIKGRAGGLTELGKSAVLLLEQNDIIVDVSHLNDAGFDDVVRIATRPFIATHSNAFSAWNHPRNLKDYQIKEIIARKGLCGINLCTIFINGEDDSSLLEIKAHIDHFLELGGEDILAMGTDYDGAPVPQLQKGIEKIHTLYNAMTAWYGKVIADKVFFENAMAFFKEYNL